MADEEASLSQTYRDGERYRSAFEEASSADPQASLAAAIAKYKQCLQIASNISLFSRNEELEDISSTDLQYLLTDYWIADLTLRLVAGDRKDNLTVATRYFDAYLTLLDSYRILSAEDVKAYERYREGPESFSVAATTDAALRRHTKITRFKEEKALKEKLAYLQKNTAALEADDSLLRSLNLTHLSLRTQQTFNHLESIAQELDILAMAPHSSAPQIPNTDERTRNRDDSAYSDRVDPPLSQLLANGRGGPILSADGKPLRPFTLTDTRTRMRQGVFRPDHSLPTMSIDEYLEEEMKRGGMISGGGEQSAIKEHVDEDDMDAADAATMKARAWDEFVEANPKGAGNRMNNG